MGGYGSTRWGWHSRKRTTDDCLSFDVAKLYRKGLLQPNTSVTSGRVTWSNGSSIGFDLQTGATDGTATLRYTRDGKEMIYAVWVVTTRPRFGGLRWWWSCPWCHRRARYLYLSPRNGRFECRLCCNLTYRSAQEHNKTMDRYLRLPPEMLMLAMNGSDHRESSRAAMALLTQHSRVLESLARYAR